MIEKGIERKKVITAIKTNWEVWKKAREPKEKIWDELIMHYMGYIDESKYENWPWRCKISRPVIQEVVDTISSAVKSALFPDNEDFFQVHGLDVAGIRNEKEVQDYLKTILFKMRFTKNMEPFIKQFCLLGNSTAGLPWRKEEVVRNRWQNGVVVPWKQTNWDSTKIEVHDMFDVVFDPREIFYSQAVTRIRRKKINIDELKTRKNFYSNLQHLRNDGIPAEPSDSQKETRRSVYGMNEGVIDKSKDVELLIMNGDLNVDGKIYRDYVGVVANRKLLLHFMPNPYWCGNPHIFSNYSGFHNELLGRGPAEPIRGLQKLIDTFSCQKADIANLIIGGFWAYAEDGVIDPENLIAKPFGLIECEDVNNIKSLVPTANPTLAFNEIEDLRTEAERSSGASKFAQGTVMPGRRTATEALQIGAGTANRFNEITTHVGEMAIEPALNMILQQQFQYEYGNPILSEEAWEGSYKVAFNGAKNSSIKELALQSFAQFTQIIGNNPLFAEFMNPPEFVKEWQKLLGIKNTDLTRTQPLSQEFPGLGRGGSSEAGPALNRPEKAGAISG